MWELIFGLPAAYVTWRKIRLNRKRLRVWKAAARSCGLQIKKVSSAWAFRLRLNARAGPVEVRIEQSERKEYGCLIVVVAPGPLDSSGIRICRAASKPQGEHEIEIGDVPFDKAFDVAGPARLLSALLDGETRHLLIGAGSQTPLLEIANGELWAETFDNRVAGLLPLLLAIGRRFAQPLDAARRLTENARQDPDAGVRLRNLLHLIREHPGTPGTVEALRTACADPSPQVRLRAAEELGAEGHGILVELAESATDDATNAQALSLLGRELAPDHATTILNVALRRRRILTARACLEALGRSGGAGAVRVLAKILKREEAELAVAAATALGTTGNPAAEPPLILALLREDHGVLVAAANALARIGSTAAVLPLKQAAERSSHLPGVRKATRQAIGEIQSRLPGASPGQLSLAPAEAGQLSLAQTETGQLSLASDPAGQLSLSGDDDPEI